MAGLLLLDIEYVLDTKYVLESMYRKSSTYWTSKYVLSMTAGLTYGDMV